LPCQMVPLSIARPNVPIAVDKLGMNRPQEANLGQICRPTKTRRPPKPTNWNMAGDSAALGLKEEISVREGIMEFRYFKPAEEDPPDVLVVRDIALFLSPPEKPGMVPFSASRGFDERFESLGLRGFLDPDLLDSLTEIAEAHERDLCNDCQTRLEIDRAIDGVVSGPPPFPISGFDPFPAPLDPFSDLGY
jgi:hypothetical protein